MDNVPYEQTRRDDPRICCILGTQSYCFSLLFVGLLVFLSGYLRRQEEYRERMPVILSGCLSFSKKYREK